MSQYMKSALTVLIGSLLGGHALCAPVDCATLRGNVEQAICASPQLQAEDAKLAGIVAQRLEQCRPEQRALLQQTQAFWLRERNACANLLSEGPDALKACVVDRIAARMAQLDRIGAACRLDAVASDYRYVDADYLAVFAALYEGREVSVWGSLRPSTCDVNSSDLTLAIRPEPGKGASFPARLHTMSAERREWLCAQNPASHWAGMVRRDRGGFYLDLDDR